MDVVICGGGIAGTTAALALRRVGVGATVLETRPADHGGGAVVRLNPNGMDALRAIDAHQAVIAASFPLLRSEFIGPDGVRRGFRITAEPGSERGLPRVLHWWRLYDVLRTEAIGRGAVFRHGSPVVDVERTGDGVTAVLEDGSRIDGDVLVGADGVHSRIRPLIDPDAPALQRLGTRTVYGFAPDPPCEPPPPDVLRIHAGARAFFAPTRDSLTGGCFWFTSLRAPDAPQSTEDLRRELMDLYADDRSPARTIVEHSDRILSFDDHALPHLPRWHDDRMVVIGDAAHVAPPASEQGAAIAVEDGVVLAQCLRDALTPEQGFAEFERRRRERVEAVVALGTGGTRRAHERGPLRALRRTRTRIAALTAWQRRPETAGPAWAYDHHIDWDV